MPKVFVYGSLKRGFYNHGFLYGQRFVDHYVTPPSYTMWDLGCFPAVTERGETAISGQIWEVSEKCLSILDRLEGHPRFYVRKEIATEHGPVFMYVHPNAEFEPPAERIRDGIWSE